MVRIIAMPRNANIRTLLEIFASAEEFSDLKPRQGEKTVSSENCCQHALAFGNSHYVFHSLYQIYNAMNQSAEIRYQLPHKVQTAE